LAVKARVSDLRGAQRFTPLVIRMAVLGVGAILSPILLGGCGSTSVKPIQTGSYPNSQEILYPREYLQSSSPWDRDYQDAKMNNP